MIKLRIGFNQPEIAGYVHVDPKPQNQSIPSYPKSLDELDLDTIVENNECVEIVAGELINFIPVSKLFDILGQISRKLRHGGKLTIGGTDLYAMSVAVINGMLNPREVNDAIYSESHKAMIPMNDVADLLTKLGLVVTNRELNGISYIIQAERP